MANDLLVSLVAPLRAAGTVAVQHQLHGVQNRRLPAAVDPAEQYDRRRPAPPLCRRQVQHLLAGVQAEIAKRQLSQDHAISK
jgi:hypothetical protein